MSTRTRNFQPVAYNQSRHTITGMLAVAALAGMVVCRKAGAVDELELANNKAGFFLDRDVVANKAALQALIDNNELRPNKDGFEMPYVAGQAVTAHDFDEFWIEGDALGAGMSGALAVGTPLTTAEGKLVPATNTETQEVVGYVSDNIDDINGAGKRFLVTRARAAKNVIP